MRPTVAVLVAVIALMSCARDQIEVVLQPEGGCDGDCGRGDFGCVTSLEVVVLGDGEEPVLERRCVAVTTTPEHNLCNNTLADSVTITVPSGARNIEVWGRGEGDDCSGVPLFVAVGDYREGDERIELDARCPLFCALHQEGWSHDFLVRNVVDLEQWPDAIDVGVGLLWDMLAFIAPGEAGAVGFVPFPIGPVAPMAAGGRVEVEGLRYDVDYAGGRCLAVTLDSPERRPQQLCLEPDAIDAPESEVHWIEPVLEERIDLFLAGLELEPPRPADAGYFVGVVRGEDGAPLGDAAVIDKPDHVRVLYPEVSAGAGGLELVGLREGTTGELGVFIMVDAFVGVIGVEAPGRATAYLVANVGWGALASRSVVVLDP